MSEREPFVSLVELGSAVGELGAALAQAQWRMDQATLDLAAEMMYSVRPALANAGVDPVSAEEQAAMLVRERLTFYSVPKVDVRLESAIRVTRGSGGLIRMLLAGARSSAQEAAGHVEVSLVAVPAGPDLPQRLQARTRDQQEALLAYLRRAGSFGSGAPQSPSRVAGVRPIPATGRWSDPDWGPLLLRFKRAWNEDRQAEPGENAGLLPETMAPDYATLTVLGGLAESNPVPPAVGALQEEARLLLAALTGEDEVHRPADGYPRDTWTDQWGRFHARVVRELLKKDGVSQPTGETIAALQAAWRTGRTFRL